MLKKTLDWLWNGWCCLSIVGIWPRFIEPKLLKTTQISIPLLKGSDPIRALQFSDLHLNQHISNRYLQKLRNRIQQHRPDIILFTGDFVCSSSMEEKERLSQFLNTLYAPHGCFAILGNHDYQKPVSANPEGDYDITSNKNSNLLRGFFRLFYQPPLTGKISPPAQQVPPHSELINLLSKSPFKLLHNNTEQITINGETLNVTGLGEYMAGRCLPAEAFANYQTDLPGIVLSHNPDSITVLKDYPGHLILSGHTHGAQVNLPWFRNRICLLENKSLRRGLVTVNDKKMYINRGVGGLIPFRWFSPPEITLITLEPAHG